MSSSAIPAAQFTPRQRAILLVLLGASFMGSVDFSILNVALPLAGAGVGMHPDVLAWIPTAFALPSAGFTLLFGRLGDLFGRRRLFLVGIGLLAAGSALGGLATSPEALLTARVVQGFASALTAPAAMSLLTTTFAEGPLRARAIGMSGALASGGFSAGALFGGSLITAIGWRAAFLVNVPIAVLVLVVTPLVIAESRQSRRPELDVPGAITVTAGLLAVVYGVLESSMLAAGAGIVLLGVFWAIELRARAPLAPIGILRLPTVKWGNFAGFVTFTVEPAMIMLITLYLEDTLRLSPLATGIILGVPGLVSVAAGPVSGRFIGRVGTRPVLVAGLAVQGLAIVPLVFVGHHLWSLVLLVPALFIGFFGHVSAIVAADVTSTSGVRDDEQGLATGLTTMTGAIAMTVGIPALSALAALRPGLGGLHLALGIAVAFCVASGALIATKLQPRQQSTNDQVQAEPLAVRG